MHTHPLRRYSRRTLLLLWLPSTLLSLSLAAILIAEPPTPASIGHFQATKISSTLFAAAPPHGQVLGDSVIADNDTRSHMLERYLRSQGSPLASHAGTFITVADRYDLDWRLLPAIAGAESSFGLHIPKNSYNAWGWGIPTGATSGVGFSSWDSAIATVGQGLRAKYFDQGLNTLPKIESRYTPPSAARADHPWVNSVEQFMWEIEHAT